MRLISVLVSTLGVCLWAALPALAQMPVPPPAPGVQLLAPADLDQMLGPIALYPDPLIAQILPAATLPSQIVVADRYVNGGGDPNLIDQQPWDPSIKGLARSPTILKWMDDNLTWTTAVGQAFTYQQQDVMDSIQRLRAQAQALGNLQSTPQENVVVDNGLIEVLPANPDVMYVPVYQPGVVYYQQAYGAPFVSFGIGLTIGAWFNHDFDWHDHHVIVWNHDQPRPHDWWSRSPAQRPRAEVAHASVWQPLRPAQPVRQDVDRGWNARPAPSTVTVIGAQSRTPDRRQAAAPPPRRAEPTVAQHTVAAPQARPANGAFIGVQSAQQTRQFSSRGQQSRGATQARPAAPAPRAAAPAHSAAPSRPASSGKR